jgi:prepilin-type N-terminal cleavage/methylation domain-containing protein
MITTQKKGFTLIEMLVVISIIAVLAGLIIGLISPLKLRVKLADTQVRMNSVHQGMALIGQSEGSATFRLQQLTEYRPSGTPTDNEPGLGGVVVFASDPGAAGVTAGLPMIGKRPAPRQADNYGEWGRRGRAHLAYPWGKKFPDPTPSATPGKLAALMGPERFLLRHMSPFNTRKLLKIANILPTKQSDLEWAENQYMTNRKQSEPWNDAWGHPLVVAATLYQPTHLTASPAPSVAGWLDGAWPTPPDNTTAVNPNTAPILFSSYGPAMETPSTVTDRSTRKALIDHLKLYQYNRSVYIAVAAVGPVARVPDADLKSATATHWGNDPTNPTIGHLDVLWAQANWVCQQAKERPFDKDWSELSFDNPMWQGNKVDYLTPTKRKSDANRDELGYDTYTGKEEHCLLSAPLEYR